MKIGSHLQFEVPDNCPKDCIYKNRFHEYGQCSVCSRCPVFNCQIINWEDGTTIYAMVNPEHFRDDWAREWQEFFKSGREPILPLQHPLANLLK